MRNLVIFYRLDFRAAEIDQRLPLLRTRPRMSANSQELTVICGFVRRDG
jgi:hypothetical protein